MNLITWLASESIDLYITYDTAGLPSCITYAERYISFDSAGSPSGIKTASESDKRNTRRHIVSLFSDVYITRDRITKIGNRIIGNGPTLLDAVNNFSEQVSGNIIILREFSDGHAIIATYEVPVLELMSREEFNAEFI